jgi:hypothetical protein
VGKDTGGEDFGVKTKILGEGNVGGVNEPGPGRAGVHAFLGPL